MKQTYPRRSKVYTGQVRYSCVVLFHSTKYSNGVENFGPSMSESEVVNKRGLASASGDTRKRVARAGGEAPHQKRGLQAANSQTRREVARMGGIARGLQRRRAKLESRENLVVNIVPA